MRGYRHLAKRKPEHRKVKLGVRTPGVCRFCSKEIRDPRTNAILTRKTWHSECVDAYKAVAWVKDLRKAILKRDNAVCSQCGKMDPEWQADHITPLAAGGSFEHHNIQTLCRPCHKAKSKTDLQLIRAFKEGKAEASHITRTA